MIVLSDTTPLHYLILIGHVDILPALFQTVIIPEAVASELVHPKAPEVVRNWFAALPDWCQVRAVTSVDVSIPLGKGERESISLAKELDADLLLVDDRLARQHAERSGLPVAGTLSLLELAAKRHLLHLDEAIRRLQSTSFYISTDVLIRLAQRPGFDPRNPEK